MNKNITKVSFYIIGAVLLITGSFFYFFNSIQWTDYFRIILVSFNTIIFGTFFTQHSNEKLFMKAFFWAFTIYLMFSVVYEITIKILMKKLPLFDNHNAIGSTEGFLAFLFIIYIIIRKTGKQD